ncbi:MAG: DUF4124 domain-containing protein [Gammaproteobacteria bacterium]|nr:DUF4124 domain-containing protein [Gammaproteobacteria bacterium]
MDSLFTTLKLMLTAALFCCSLSIAAAEVYKWQDENGKWHFSDKPPVTKKDQKKVAKESAEEVATVGWKDTPKVKNKRQYRNSSARTSSNKSRKCNRSKTRSDYHDKRLKRGTSTNGSNYHNKKLRQERWKQLTNNC